MKLFPAKFHERATVRKLWRQTGNSSLLPAKCWRLLHVICSITWLFVFHRCDPLALLYNKSLNDCSPRDQSLSVIIAWLAPWAGKTNQTLPCDWLPERARWSYLHARDYPCVPLEKFPRKPYNKSFIDQACSVKMAGSLPRSFLPISSHVDLTLGPVGSCLGDGNGWFGNFNIMLRTFLVN